MLTNSIYDFIVLAVGSLIARATKNSQPREQAHASAMTVHNLQQFFLSESHPHSLSSLSIFYLSCAMQQGTRLGFSFIIHLHRFECPVSLNKESKGSKRWKNLAQITGFLFAGFPAAG